MIVTCAGCGKRFTSRLTECPFCKTANPTPDLSPPAHGAEPSADAAAQLPPPPQQYIPPSRSSLLQKQVEGQKEGTNPIVFTVIKLVVVLALLGGGAFAVKSFFTPDKPTVFLGASRGNEVEMPIEKLVNAGPEVLERRLMLVAKFGKLMPDDEGMKRFEAISAAGISLPIYVSEAHAGALGSLKPGQTFAAYGTIENKGLGFNPKPALVVK
ncbi:MAG: hypothetical protein IPK07_08120 [Deltaproteobacteria bacterium]|nr:hypothetical protein [Deltaproteobacteria bacterium]